VCCRKIPTWGRGNRYYWDSTKNNSETIRFKREKRRRSWDELNVVQYLCAGRRERENRIRCPPSPRDANKKRAKNGAGANGWCMSSHHTRLVCLFLRQRIYLYIDTRGTFPTILLPTTTTTIGRTRCIFISVNISKPITNTSDRFPDKLYRTSNEKQ